MAGLAIPTEGHAKCITFKISVCTNQTQNMFGENVENVDVVGCPDRQVQCHFGTTKQSGAIGVPSSVGSVV